MEHSFVVSTQCIMCSKNFKWEEVIIIKAPDGVCFCLDCAEKHNDDKEYDAYNAWITHDFRGKEIFDFK